MFVTEPKPLLHFFRGSVTHPPPSLKWNPSVSKEMCLFATHILGLAVSV